MTPPPEPASAVLELVATLAARRPLRPDAVRRETGIELSRVESANPYWLFFESDHDAKRAVARIELRLPTSPERAEESLLTLELGAVGCLSLDEVLEKYGRDLAALDVPPPHGPPGQPVYYVYRFPWGRMSFGVRPGKPECVTRIVLETKPGA